jgi:hypothetical protein
MIEFYGKILSIKDSYFDIKFPNVIKIFSDGVFSK